MQRLVVLLIAFVLACTPPAPSAAPTKAPDVGKSRIDIVYSGLVQDSYYKPTPRELLTAALDAIKKEARDSGGKEDVATPDFGEDRDRFLEDFRKFRAAAEQLAAKNPQLNGTRISTAAIKAMLNVHADCHNYYVPGRGGAVLHGLAAPVDQLVQTRLLPGGVAYLAWREFDSRLVTEVRAAFDDLLARGAKSWLFDVRNNVGGEGAQTMVSWFVQGGTIWREIAPDGKKTEHTARSEFFLPQKYQLPIAVAVNERSFSDAELFTLGFKGRGRGRVFGTKSGGCLGAVLPVTLPDGAHVGIAETVYIGPISDEPLNNIGITPDVVVSTGDPVQAAAEYLRSVSK